MKLAITGKGGVGKSTLAAALAILLAKKESRVLAIDADPDANLASALGIPPEDQKKIIPISRRVALIEERTGAKVKQYGQIFKLNPHVSDIADSQSFQYKNIALLVLGAVTEGGGGCACPENVFTRSLVTDLILEKSEALIMDMEAGIEHLGRATARGVDTMVVVVEPGQRSIDSANRLIRMGNEIGLDKFSLVANKITGPEDEIFIRNNIADSHLIGIIPFSQKIRDSDKKECSVIDGLNAELISIFEEILTRLQEKKR